METNAELWNALYADYVDAHEDYLQLKLDSGSAYRPEPLGEETCGRRVAEKLEQTHRALHEFLARHPALMQSPQSKPVRQPSRRRHPTETLITQPKGASVRERPLELA